MSWSIASRSVVSSSASQLPKACRTNQVGSGRPGRGADARWILGGHSLKGTQRVGMHVLTSCLCLSSSFHAPCRKRADVTRARSLATFFACASASLRCLDAAAAGMQGDRQVHGNGGFEDAIGGGPAPFWCMRKCQRGKRRPLTRPYPCCASPGPLPAAVSSPPALPAAARIAPPRALAACAKGTAVSASSHGEAGETESLARAPSLPVRPSGPANVGIVFR